MKYLPIIFFILGFVFFITNVDNTTAKTNNNTTTKTKIDNQQFTYRIDTISKQDQDNIYSHTLKMEVCPDISTLTKLIVKHYDMQYNIRYGYLVVNHKHTAKYINLFKYLYEIKFPIHKINPMYLYSGNDKLSMNDNNTSAFNCRFIARTKKLSNHSYGMAIDINPKLNPYIKRNITEPKGSQYNTSIPGTITREIANVITSMGFKWGGDWKHSKDYQHFDIVKH